MSSDSEDDFCYTNAVSVLKKVIKKGTSDNKDFVPNKKLNINLLDESDSEEIKPKETRKTNKYNLNEEIQTLSDEDDSDIEIINPKKVIQSDQSNLNQNSVKDDSCVIIPGEESDLNTVDIISVIDNVLQRGKKGQRGRRRKKNSNTTQRNTRKKTLKNKEKCVLLSSDEDYNVLPNENEINYEMSVKVIWKSQHIKKFTLRRFEKIASIFKYFSELENLPESRLLFTVQERVISKDDTPETLNMTAATIIEGGILSENIKALKSDVQDKDQIKLKVQTKDKKHPLIISLKSFDTMDILMCKCAYELNIEINKLKFYFDGDIIKASDTPRSLQLEGDECIDCIIK